jgi:hypothetical protein
VASIQWRLIGSFEALDGMLLMGISTALLSRSSSESADTLIPKSGRSRSRRSIADVPEH